MKYVVLSRKHGLHPVARWLGVEVGPGDVACAPLREPYRRAWAGLLETARLPARKRGQSVGEWLEGCRFTASLRDGSAALLTDCPKVTSAALALGVPHLYGTLPDIGTTRSPIRLAGWWDGSSLVGPHWQLIDWGLWPGGMGPEEVGGVSLVTTPTYPLEAFTPYGDMLKAASFRGLVSLDMAWDTDAWRSGALRAGWPTFASQAWLWAQPSVTAALADTPAPLPPFVVAASVSVPPYPFNADRPAQRVGVEPWAIPSLVMFDAAKEGDGLATAGLDGLFALACGKGQVWKTAQGQAVETAASLGLAEKQTRPDVGWLVHDFLAGLERQGWL